MLAFHNKRKRGAGGAIVEVGNQARRTSGCWWQKCQNGVFPVQIEGPCEHLQVGGERDALLRSGPHLLHSQRTRSVKLAFLFQSCLSFQFFTCFLTTFSASCVELWFSSTNVRVCVGMRVVLQCSSPGPSSSGCCTTRRVCCGRTWTVRRRTEPASSTT